MRLEAIDSGGARTGARPRRAISLRPVKPPQEVSPAPPDLAPEHLEPHVEVLLGPGLTIEDAEIERLGTEGEAGSGRIVHARIASGRLGAAMARGAMARGAERGGMCRGPAIPDSRGPVGRTHIVHHAVRSVPSPGSVAMISG